MNLNSKEVCVLVTERKSRDHRTQARCNNISVLSLAYVGQQHEKMGRHKINMEQTMQV